MELSELYSSKIIEIAGRLPKIEPLENPDASAKKSSRICGAVVKVSLKMENGLVSAYSHDISSDALGQTSASIVSEHIIGSSEEELRFLQQQMIDMLKHDRAPPSGKWSDFKYLQPVKSYPARHSSTLLIFDAVIECLDIIKSRK